MPATQASRSRSSTTAIACTPGDGPLAGPAWPTPRERAPISNAAAGRHTGRPLVVVIKDMGRTVVALCCVFAWSSPTRADVVDSSAGGFTGKTVLQASAPARNVYRAIVDRLGARWESSHTFS